MESKDNLTKEEKLQKDMAEKDAKKTMTPEEKKA